MNDEPFCLDAPALPARRRIAVERYCAGIRPDDVAREAGVTRATLARWLREPACRAYMTRITERAADDASRLIRAGTLEAVRTELDILRGANPSAALAACRDLLDRAGVRGADPEGVRVVLIGCSEGFLAEAEEAGDETDVKGGAEAMKTDEDKAGGSADHPSARAEGDADGEAGTWGK